MTTAAEIQRLISNIVRIGTVVEIDYETSRARLQCGDNLTNWLSWAEKNGAATSSWAPPEMGELWLIVSAGGDLSQGVMTARLQTDENQPPSRTPDETRTRYPDGTETSYNHVTHTMEINVPEGGTVNVIAEKINLGETADLQPSTLGDNLADALEELILQINNSQVIGNLGAPSSPIQLVKMVQVLDLLRGGNSYSKKNRNQ